MVVLLAFIAVIFCDLNPIKAEETNKLLINEIYPSPLDGGYEWVEIYNSSEDVVDLSKYQLKDGGVAAKKIIGNIEANGYYIFEISSGWLNNSGDILYLIEIDTNNIIDRLAYGNWDKEVLVDIYAFNSKENAPNPSAGESISRIPNGHDSNVDKDDFRVVTISKGSENILPKYSDHIIINEIVPAPTDGSANEYIEIFNTGEDIVELSGWFLDDIDGGSSPYKIPEGVSIAPFGFVLFYNYQSEIILNDDGDSVRLTDPNGDIKDTVSYSNSKRGHSYSLIEQIWQWSITLTPMATNILSFEPTEDEENQTGVVIGIKEAKSKEVGSVVLVEGYVTVLPGVLGKQYLYIQDENCGIQIYNYWAKFPTFTVGQLVRVLGEIAVSAGEVRIKTVSELDLIILDEIIRQDPQTVSLYEINSDLLGTIITVQGKVKSTSGANFVISGSPEINVSIKESTNIKKPKMRRGDKVKISGVLSIYNGEFRILPFDLEGVKILTSGALPVTGYERRNYQWNLFQRVRSKLKNFYASLPRRFQVEIPC